MSTKNLHHTPVRKVRYRYVPIQQTLESEELGTYITYGISVRAVEEEISFISDVSTDFAEVQCLAELCTEKQLDPLHLDDLIEDFLIDSEMVLN